MKQENTAQNRSVINFIINRRTLIEKIFIAIILLSLLCLPFVGINYDLSKYLPVDAKSKQGLDLMEQEFGYPGTARVMIGDVSLYEAKIYKDRIEKVDGVSMVLWCDTTTDVYQSSLFINYDEIRDYYKDSYAVMDITFEDGDSEKTTHQALREIEKIVGEKGYFTGSAVQNKSLSETLIREVLITLVIGIFMIALILCLTTTSWFEPVLFLLIMAIAIIINMGSNIFLGSISFLTFSVAALLQLAISMDYSIFLLHTYTRELQAGEDPPQAMANAIRCSISSILASGATTIVGFIVLALMKFSIGRDMGIVLAKGIVISLLTVLFLMPALILRFHDRIEKTAHRSFMPSFDRLGVSLTKCGIPILIAVAVLLVPAYAAQGMNHFSFGNAALGSSEGTKAYDDDREIVARFGRSNLLLAIVPNDSMVTEKRLNDAISELPYVKSVTSLAGTLPEGIPESILPKSLTGLLHTENYSRIMIYVKSSDESDFAFACTDEIRSIVEAHYPQNAYVIGVTPSTQDIKSYITKDYSFVNLLSLLGVALVILITFRSLIIPIIVMIPIEVAIFFNMALPYLFGDSMIYMGYIIVSCLQLGATVDYSILLTNHYLDCRTEKGKKDAAIEAISLSALSVLTSGGILTVAGYGLCFVSTVAAVSGMGRLVGRGAVFSMALVLCLLPTLLILSDRIIFNQKRRMETLDKLRRVRSKKVKLSLAYLRKQRHSAHNKERRRTLRAHAKRRAQLLKIMKRRNKHTADAKSKEESL